MTMEKRNPDTKDIYEIGKWIARLALLPADYPWSMAKLSLEALLGCKKIKGYEFIGEDAEYYIAKYGKEYENEGKPIGRENQSLFQLKCEGWEGRLDVVLKQNIVCRPETHMDVEALRSGGKAFLEPEEWEALQPLEQQGLDEAARCLLFNCFTSSEFMSLRTVESLLRRWYEKKTGNAIKDTTWGNVIKKLDDEFPEQNRPKEISYLYFLKERRNDVAHPELISSENHAMMTFLQVIDACKALRNHLV